MTERIDRLFAGGLFLLGVFVVWRALEYGYTRDGAPGPGFFPFWVGLGLAGLSLVNLVRSLQGSERLTGIFDRTGLYATLAIVGALIGYIVLSPWIGMLIGSGLLIPATAFAIRRRWTGAFAATILAIAVVFPVICYFLFGVYLRVPLERGVFGF